MKKRKNYFEVHPNKRKPKRLVFIAIKRKQLKFEISCNILSYIKAMDALANAMRCAVMIPSGIFNLKNQSNEQN